MNSIAVKENREAIKKKELSDRMKIHAQCSTY